MKPLPPIVFITGTFLGNNCWDEWKSLFESKGYKCIAPPWPHKNSSPEELRNLPADNAIATNTITSITDYFASLVNEMPEKPILIGHSFGGLVVQLLLQLEMGRAGVAVHPFPPRKADRFRLSFLKALWETMVLFSSTRKTYLIPFRKWKSAIANELDCDLQKELYYEYAIPESKKIIRDVFKCKTKIDFTKPHAPLLITSGTSDKLVPASINYHNYMKYKSGNSTTRYKEFKGHNHLVFGHSIWKEEADFILDWLDTVNN